ncbi:MAG: RagB/SusD family nutrient uptake outer membrane protein [Prevotella sp.]|nr:RagB/SusD family nutrient uptake outer membrane protein [Prevotella sp.]
MITIFSKYRKGAVKTVGMLVTGLTFCLLTSCGDFLEIVPENNLPVDNFWTSKSDVDASLSSGYYYLRTLAQDGTGSSLLEWGEHRAGVIYYTGSSALQSYTVKATTSSAKWGTLYQIINQANLVLEHAAQAQASDQTYTQQELNSHYCEAYFLRALAYFYIVRNWRDAPLSLRGYETDETPLLLPKSSEAEIIAQIKKDLNTAIELGAAKDQWDTTWETKGKATSWSIYALMADVCLWNHDFDECIKYCDKILEDKTGLAPKFISTNTHAAWFAMFCPGNSDESIYEVQWNADKLSNNAAQVNQLYNLFSPTSSYYYRMSTQAGMDFQQDWIETINISRTTDESAAVRTQYGSYYSPGGNTTKYIWKYLGDNASMTQQRTVFDNNFIIYRVSEVMLMKAEALIMRTCGQNDDDKAEAVALINKIRTRTNLSTLNADALTDLSSLMDALLYERVMEFVGEGKAWYDFLRVARYTDTNGVVDFKEYFINKVLSYQEGATASRIKSVLMNENAWYLPVPDSEIKVNGLLLQNPYY